MEEKNGEDLGREGEECWHSAQQEEKDPHPDFTVSSS